MRVILLILVVGFVSAEIPEDKYYGFVTNGGFEKGDAAWGWWGEAYPFRLDGLHARTGDGYAHLGNCQDCIEGFGQELHWFGFPEPHVFIIRYNFGTDDLDGGDYFTCRLWSFMLNTYIADLATCWSDEGPTNGYMEAWAVVDLGWVPPGVDVNLVCYLDDDGDALESWVYLDDLEGFSEQPPNRVWLPIVYR